MEKCFRPNGLLPGPGFKKTKEEIHEWAVRTAYDFCVLTIDPPYGRIYTSTGLGEINGSFGAEVYMRLVCLLGIPTCLSSDISVS
ncbi:hypothetical protein I306_05012 [Cryptococcus gattii EJB2]|uniref:Uncharacterized protein n=1 Tax=Cryptococcus gattii EJB2 TaxID=1296103 RepID=A0ABR5BQP6_9TREE|nr:hypothetical protein I306_05012 [Cryptococcus gattii EJB2]